MPVITISRQYGSGGREIAVRVGERLGYRYFDRDLMAQVANEAGLSTQEVVDFTEEDHSVRGFFDRLFLGGPRETVTRARRWSESPDGVRTFEMIDLDAQQRITLVRGIIEGAYRRGNIVIVGRAGQAVLRNRPDVLHVRIVAPLEERLLRVQEQEQVTRETAQSLIAKRDAAAQDYLKRFYQLDVADPLLYHLVVNTGQCELETAAQIIVQAVLCLPLQVGTAESAA